MMEQSLTQKSEQPTVYWQCWVCGKRYSAEVEGYECGSEVINKVNPPKEVLPSCGIQIEGIVQNPRLLTVEEKANNYIGLIKQSWAKDMAVEGGGRFAQPCCWCNQIRQVNNYDAVVGPCEFCKKRLLILPDAEFNARIDADSALTK